jgi:beta-lactam-binding protein with PASTA domain
MQRTGLAILALLIALLTSAGMASPGRAQTAQSDVTRATKAPATKPGLMPNFVGLMRGNASALAQRYGLEPQFDGATSRDARVGSQSPEVGTPIFRADMPVRLQMEARKSPLQRMPNFVGLTRSDASALAQRYGLEPLFDGATSRDARVGSQSPEVGMPISSAGMPVRLQMEARKLPLLRVPNFVGLTRGEASALAQRYGLEPLFDGAASKDARVASQSPEVGTPIFPAGMLARLQMEARKLPLLRVPNFVGLVRGDASALAQRYGLEPAFDGATSRDARVGSQSPEVGVPISSAGMPVRLEMEARKLPLLRVPNFVGLTRSDASALAQRYGVEPAFDGAMNKDARVASQSPDVGTPIFPAGMPIRLQMEARKLPLLRVPNFAGLMRSDARALAQRYGLEPMFDGAASRVAHVSSQSPRFGTPIVRTGMPVRLQMEAPAPAPLPPSPTPAPAPQPTPAPTPQPTPAPAPQPTPAPAPQPTPAPAPQPTPAPTPQPAPTPPPTPASPTPAPAPPPTPPPSPANACVSRDLISWLTATPGQAVSPTCQGSETRNWLILLAIAAGLVGGTWALFRRPRTPGTPEHIDPKINDPQTGSSTARLATQTVSAGLAGMTVSVQAADARRFEVRYVMERDARSGSDAIAISVDGGDDGR